MTQQTRYTITQTFELLGDPGAEVYDSIDAAQAGMSRYRSALIDLIMDMDYDPTARVECSDSGELEVWVAVEATMSDSDSNYTREAAESIADAALEMHEMETDR